MTQSSLERSVARATGESVERIRRMGFSLLSPPHPNGKSHRAQAVSPPARLHSQTTTDARVPRA